MEMAGIVIFLSVALSGGETAIADDVESCLLSIFKRYFGKQSVLLITEPTSQGGSFRGRLLPDLDKDHTAVIGSVMKKGRWSLQVYDSGKYIGLPPKLKFSRVKNCFAFVRGDEATFDLDLDRLQENPLWDPSGRTVIVVRSAGDDGAELARRVIDGMWTRSKAVDCLVMVVEDKALQFYTWFPYKHPDCTRVSTVVHLDTYRRKRFLRKAHLFPEKMSGDLEGCELVAATDTCIPYVFADENNDTRFVDGLEFHIVTSLSDMLNFKLSTVRPSDMWTTFVNNSVAGAFKMLVDQEADMAFSCLMLTRERYLLALALPPYFEDALAWFVPSPTVLPHTVDVFLTFPFDFWLVMLSVMTAAIFVVILLVYAERRSNWGSVPAVGYVLRLVGVALNVPVDVPTKNFNLRLFVFLFFIYSMHITVAFQSSLFSLYRKPQYSKSYSSLQSAVDAGLFVYLRPSNQDLYNQSDHALWNRILQPGRFDYLKDFGAAFSEIAYEKTAMALFIKSTGIYMVSVYFTDDYGTPQVLWLKNIFAPYPVTMYMSPGNPLYSLFRDRLHRIIDSGLIGIWLSRAILGGKSQWGGDSFANSPLDMAHMGGPFFLLLLLSTVAVFVFFLEVLVHRYLWKETGVKKASHRHFFMPVMPYDWESGKSQRFLD